MIIVFRYWHRVDWGLFLMLVLLPFLSVGILLSQHGVSYTSWLKHQHVPLHFFLCRMSRPASVNLGITALWQILWSSLYSVLQCLWMLVWIRGWYTLKLGSQMLLIDAWSLARFCWNHNCLTCTMKLSYFKFVCSFVQGAWKKIEQIVAVHHKASFRPSFLRNK